VTTAAIRLAANTKLLMTQISSALLPLSRLWQSGGDNMNAT
jgi:hypothetical protein